MFKSIAYYTWTHFNTCYTPVKGNFKWKTQTWCYFNHVQCCYELSKKTPQYSQFYMVRKIINCHIKRLLRKIKHCTSNPKYLYNGLKQNWQTAHSNRQQTVSNLPCTGQTDFFHLLQFKCKWEFHNCHI